MALLNNETRRYILTCSIADYRMITKFVNGDNPAGGNPHRTFIDRIDWTGTIVYLEATITEEELLIIKLRCADTITVEDSIENISN